MAKDATTPFEIPAEMRAFAEQSVERAKEAFDQFMSSAQQAMTTLEDQAAAAQAGAKSVNTKAMSYAERNVATAFEFAKKLVQAKDAQDLARLQSEFVEAQMKALTEQARDLGEAATRTMGARK
ncbi:MAG TPA: phasin family protein [Xanthobacteraceae bacterium]|nr:phasin family protein [Xanthobacteraceae bacterium]